jgi:MFS family permease
VVEQSDADHDPNVVWWDGEDDPENPMNWKSFRKWSAIAIVSGVTFLTPLGSAIFAPGIPEVMDEFNSTSELLTGFIVSVYVLGFAFGPLGKYPFSHIRLD